MNTLVLTNEFEDEMFGGAGTAVTGMIRMFERNGVQQTILVPRSQGSIPCWIEQGSTRLLAIPRNDQYFGTLGIIRADVLLNQFPELHQQWDLIHIQAINFAPLAYALAQKDVPVIYSVYSLLREEFAESPETDLQMQFRIQEELLEKCQRIHLISYHQKKELIKRYPRFAPKVDVLYLGVDCPRGIWCEGIADKFLYVGRLLEYKGIEDLIKAIYLVKQAGKPLRLDVVGIGEESYEQRLKLLVKTMHLSPQIHFLGWKTTEEVWQLMSRASALVVPSRRETLGLVALEGMTIGVPLIAAKTGGLTELADSTGALTFEAENINSLAKALITAIDHPQIICSLAQRSLKRARDFSWGNLSTGYMKLYLNL